MNTATKICTADFTAMRVRKSRWDESKGFEWSLSFVPWGSYKSPTCRRAEDAGVRYASHRKGYRASERAMKRFLASYAELPETGKL